MVTIKLPYTTSPSNKKQILAVLNNQATVTRFLFNRLIDSNGNLTQKELTNYANSMNNVSIDSWLKQSSVYESKAIYGSYVSKLQETIIYNEGHPGTKKILPTVIFGSRKSFLARCENKITREEFLENRDPPIVSVGEALPYGNRKFELLVVEENKIIFKPKCGIKIDLQLPRLRKNYKKVLQKLQNLMEKKKLPVKIALDLAHIYITYDEELLSTPIYSPVKNRLISIDKNPNYIGYSIIDWYSQESFKIIKTGVLSIKKLNDKQFSLWKEKLPSDHPKNIHLNNQRHFEIYEIVKALCNIAVAYNVEGFGIEKIFIDSMDKGKSSKYNRLVNNFWCRDIFDSNLKKRLNICGIKYLGVFAAYSSFVGNLLHRDHPDMIASSIEISRRAFIKLNGYKFAMFPSFTKSVGALTQSLEELGLEASKLMRKVKKWKDLYGKVKNLGLRYRVPLGSFKFKVFRLDCSPWVESLLSPTMV